MLRTFHLKSTRRKVLLICGLTVIAIWYATKYADSGTITQSVPASDRSQRTQRMNKFSHLHVETGTNGNTGNTGLLKQSPQTEKTAHTIIQERFAQRKHLLENGCTQYRQARGSSGRAYRGDFLSVPHEVFYCVIEKVACTEWRGLFRNMSKYNVTSYTLKDWPRVFHNSTGNPYTAAQTKFFFVREPYSRLLSGYVDKLFSPNVLFWNMVGKHAVKRFRPQPSKLSLQCGHDVTFAEFIDYVIDAEKTGVGAEAHFTPQFKHCYVCDFPYSYIGHLETLQEDREFLLNVMRSPVQSPPDYPLRDLKNQASWYIRDYKKYKNCMTKDEALRRLWQKLKIRGHLLSSRHFPLTPKQSKNITEQEFLRIASAMVAESLNVAPSIVKANKRQALKEAFDTVPLSKKRQLAQLFHWDFQLFGYDPYPPEVFQNSLHGNKENTTHGFFNLRS